MEILLIVFVVGGFLFLVLQQHDKGHSGGIAVLSALWSVVLIAAGVIAVILFFPLIRRFFSGGF